MLAYAAANPRPAARNASPRTLALIVAGHAVLLGLVMTARGDLPIGPRFEPTDVTFIDPPKPPPPPPPTDPRPPRPRSQSHLDRPQPEVRADPQPSDHVDQGPVVLDPRPGPALDPITLPFDPPTPAVVRKAARLATPADELRPPYPESKRRTGEQASLRLALEIDAAGRVIAVEPVGAADPAFLDAARRHILRHWRYRPATEDGRGIASRTVITLRFELAE